MLDQQPQQQPPPPPLQQQQQQQQQQNTKKNRKPGPLASNKSPIIAAADMVRARKTAADAFGGPASPARLFPGQVDEVPTLRAVSRRPQSSRHSFSGKHEFRMLPPLHSPEITESERRDLLAQKLTQCTYVYDFLNPSDSLEDKSAKQRTLAEVLEYMTDNTGVITIDLYPKLFRMVSANLFRTVPPQINAFGDPYDPEEDEPREEPAWPHLYLVYQVFLRFLESGDFNNSAARPYIDQAFTTQLLELFDCEDVRERESLKTVLHRIYGKMLGMRSFIRRSINNIFLQFTYETQRHNGIAELLEILGSIINGFTVPLKEEHVNFLHRVLLPLHKARPMTLYYAQLAYCTVQFLEKEPQLADTIVKTLLRFWPKVNSPKEVMFVNELEGIMDVIEPVQFTKICEPLFEQLVKCIVGPHFQIAERALCMWRNAYFVRLITENIELILPIALSGIYQHSRAHWNRNIHNQVYQILRFFVTVNEDLFEQCLAQFRRMRGMERKKKKTNVGWWTTIEKMAVEKAGPTAVTAATTKSSKPGRIGNNRTSTAALTLAAKEDPTVIVESILPPSPPHKSPTSKAITITTAAATTTTDTKDTAATTDNHGGSSGTPPPPPPLPISNGNKNTATHEEQDADNNHGGMEVAGGMATDDTANGKQVDGKEENGNQLDGPNNEVAVASALPASKLDDPATMCCEMDEDEFIQELDKFVDMIKAEDPETAMANGMVPLDESDAGSQIIDDILVGGNGEPLAYGQQPPGHNMFDGHHSHVAMLHNIAAADTPMPPSGEILDPTSMQIDYAIHNAGRDNNIRSSEVPISLAPSLIHQHITTDGRLSNGGGGGSSRYSQHHHQYHRYMDAGSDSPDDGSPPLQFNTELYDSGTERRASLPGSGSGSGSSSGGGGVSSIPNAVVISSYRGNNPPIPITIGSNGAAGILDSMDMSDTPPPPPSSL